MGIVWSVIGIFICGGLGGFAAWAFVTSAGLGGNAWCHRCRDHRHGGRRRLVDRD